MDEQEITVSQASERASQRGQHLSRSYLARAASLGKIKGRRITDPVGRSYWLIGSADLERYLNSERKPGAKKGSKRRKGEASQPTPPSGGMKEAKTPPPAPPQVETVLPIEGGHIRIDALQPSGGNWLHAEAVQGDVQATIRLRPSLSSRGYILEQSYDRLEASAPGRMGRKQDQHAKELLALLEERVLEALQAAGWEQVDRSPTGTELWHYSPQKAEAAE